jgi:RNA polymerase sigma-54 factor
MPRLRLNPYYLNMMRNGHKALDGETKQWLEKRRSQAIDFLSSINERRKTITKVTEAIFEVQRDFLDEGVNGLKPLTLKQIAEMAGVHESTVSRVTTNKYVDTPQGIYKLKFFFSSDLNTDNGSNISATVVKEKIKEMVQNEDPAKPFSDQAISNALKSEGIQVARRTVQKYREELSIPSSSKRKRKW